MQANETHDGEAMNPQIPVWRSKAFRRGLLYLAVVAGLLGLVPTSSSVLRQYKVLAKFRSAKCDFSTSKIGPRWVRKLVGEEMMQSIEPIDALILDSKSLPLVVEHPNLFRNVAILTISKDIVDNAAFWQLVETDRGIFSQVWFFQAKPSNFGDEHLAHLVALPKLRVLSLKRTRVTDDGFAELAKLPNLEEICLDCTKIDGSGLHHLTGLKQLRKLRLCETQINDDALAVIGGLRTLRGLLLVDTKITDSGLAHLTNLTDLKSLYVDSNSISDAGMEYVARLSNIEDFSAATTEITDAGLMRLASLPKLNNASVQIGTRVTDEGAEKFTKEHERLTGTFCFVK